MPRFCANLSFLFQELELPQRIFAAAERGFAGVEVLFPYDTPVPVLRDALSVARIPLVLINAPPPNYTGGPRGFAATEDGALRFASDFQRALRYADALGARNIHVMSGAAEGDAARARMVANLRTACDAAPDHRVLIEPINRNDMPGYFLNDFDLAAEIIHEVARPNLFLQFDAYHAHILTGDVMATWDRHAHLVAHVQIAGHPGRHEPVGGDIDYPAFFARLDADGYTGFVSAEYHPKGTTGEGLGWMVSDAAQLPR